MRKLLVYERMTPDPITVSSDTFLSDACRLMVDHEIRRLPVVDDGKLVGILSWSDVREALPPGMSSSDIFEQDCQLELTQVGQVMTRDPITLTPLATIDQAAQIMLEHKIGSLPVALDGKVLGIITESDLFRLLVTETAGWSARI
jgi:acetoin utilization protein AcuB